MVHNIFGDVEVREIVQVLYVASVFVKNGKWELLNRSIQPPPSVY